MGKLKILSLLPILGIMMIAAGIWMIPRNLERPTGETIQQSPQAKPESLYIPKLGKVLSISDGQVTNDQWVISENGVSYLTSSSLPGEGNTVVYGHNRSDILGGLPQVEAGDPIYLVMNDGKIIRYRVFDTKDVPPTQVDILNQTETSQLTLYTCNGLFDKFRFVVSGKLEKVI